MVRRGWGDDKAVQVVDGAGYKVKRSIAIASAAELSTKKIKTDKIGMSLGQVRAGNGEMEDVWHVRDGEKLGLRKLMIWTGRSTGLLSKPMAPSDHVLL